MKSHLQLVYLVVRLTNNGYRHNYVNLYILLINTVEMKIWRKTTKEISNIPIAFCVILGKLIICYIIITVLYVFIC